MTTTPMSQDEVIRMAREAGLTVGTNISGVMLVGSPSTPGIAHIDIDEMAAFAAVARADLEAEVARLREALEELLRHFTRSPSSLADSETRIKAHAALKETP